MKPITAGGVNVGLKHLLGLRGPKELMMISYPNTARPSITKNHVDGPLLTLRDGRMHWLTLWERVLLALDLTDALKLERKHWK